MKFTVRICCIILGLCIAGCASGKQRIDATTLRPLYAQQRKAPKKNIVIFVPDVMGSLLDDPIAGRTIWGKEAKRHLAKLPLPIDGATLARNRDNVRGVQPIERYRWFPSFKEIGIYDSMQEFAVKVGGFTLQEDFYGFAYDWRRDLVEAAQELGHYIEKVKRIQGDPDLKVVLLCHKAGGLVARYYAKYGIRDVLDRDPLPDPTYAGAVNIEKIIMLGTANSGSLEALQWLLEGKVIPKVGRLPVETLFTMPSFYQLLPHEGSDILITKDGSIQDITLYDAESWEEYGWSLFDSRRVARLRKQSRRKFRRKQRAEAQEDFVQELNKRRYFLSRALKRAQQFHKALTNGDPFEERGQVSYVLLGFGCQPTPKRAVVEQKRNGKWTIRFKTKKVIDELLIGFGDGTVLKESLLGVRPVIGEDLDVSSRHLLSDYDIFVCQDNVDIVNNPTYLDNVLHALLK
ncbi:esterase/lipase family protein [Candidatus Omnitrophota bacterium]